MQVHRRYEDMREEQFCQTDMIDRGSSLLDGGYGGKHIIM